MLILTRKIGETLLIGDGIKVDVLGIKGNKLRIDIAAPADTKVRREGLIDGRAAPPRHPTNG